MNHKRGFGSDNNSGIHPEVLHAITQANTGHCPAYGDDPYTEEAVRAFRHVFGEHIEVFLVCTGTGANVLGLGSSARPYHATICARSSHLNVDECGAPENFTGCKILSLPTENGKITPHQIAPLLELRGDEHHSQPKFVSISQPTELGTVYTIEEITDMATFAHDNGLILHMDGARLSNAAVSLGTGLRALTGDAGVDILSFGGTKNGLMIGEAVIFFDPAAARDFKYIRKQGMHLVSKMRFLSTQFTAFLKDDLWRQNALHANSMAQLLAQKLEDIPACPITLKVESNAVFVVIPRKIVEDLQAQYFFYIVDSSNCIARLMTSFDTTAEDIDGFVAALQELVMKKCKDTA